MAVSTCTNATPSITAPVFQMKPVSPVVTPSSMIRALRLGRYRVAIVVASWKPSTAAIQPE